MIKSFKSIFDGIHFPFVTILFQLLTIYVALFMAVSNPSVDSVGISMLLMALGGLSCLCTIAGWASKVIKKVEELETKPSQHDSMTFLVPALLFALPFAALPMIHFRRATRWVSLTGLAIAVCTNVGCTFIPSHWLTRKCEGPFAWPPKPFAKVVGYSFKPSEMGAGVVTKEGIDLEKLREVAVAKSNLSKDQANRLVGAVRKAEEVFPEMLCYEPHHVFVFYSERNDVVAAIEVCFTCNGIRTWPDAKMVRTLFGIRCDLPELARLADELGLGLGSSEMTLPKYLRRLKRQQADETRVIKSLTEQRS